MAQSQAELLRAYLIVGADALKRGHAVERLKGRLDPAMADFNLDARDVDASTDPQSVVNSLQSLPFGPGFRLVILTAAGAVPKALSEALVAYLEDPNPTSVLCLACESLPRNTRLYKAFQAQGKNAIVSCEPKRRHELPAYLAEICRKRFGKQLDMDAAKEIVSRAGESMVMLDGIVAQLTELTGAAPRITLADVKVHVARTAEVKPWDFLDAVSARDANQALSLYSLMGEGSFVGLHSLLVGRIRELICAKALDERGAGASLASELGKADWQVKNHIRWSRQFSRDELSNALRDACKLERVLKGSGDSDAAFVRFIASICG